jgi:thiamine biosynthesis protein ThiI
MPGSISLLVRFSGDLTTKSRGTRVHFVRRLARNIRDALNREAIAGRVERRWSRLFVHSEDPRAPETVSRVFGVQSVSRATTRRWSSLEDIVAAGVEIFGTAVADTRFAVRARRSGDRRNMPFKSIDVERALGTELLHRARKVDLDHPEVTAHVEIHPEQAFFFDTVLPGPGGLPLGVEGRALALISGGFDSAVAAWQMMKRGVDLDFLFFNLGGAAHAEGVLRVSKLLSDNWIFGGRPTLHSIDLRPFVEALQAASNPRYWQILLKRQMMRIAARVATELDLPALVTGEAMGQVSSQTLPNLAVIDAASGMLVMRPLIAFNKDEIVQLARRIGTYDISAQVAEFCAMLAKNPATSASGEAVEREEDKLPTGLVNAALASRSAIALRRFDLSSLGQQELEIDHVPAGAHLVDVRSKTAYDAWHPSGAEWMDYFAAIHDVSRFDPEVDWVFVCEIGLKSAHLAEQLASAGLSARHIGGGIRTLLVTQNDQDPLLDALAAPAVRD